MTTSQQIAYNAGRDFFVKGWEKKCPYVATSPLSKFWWRGWFDTEKIKTQANQ